LQSSAVIVQYLWKPAHSPSNLHHLQVYFCSTSSTTLEASEVKNQGLNSLSLEQLCWHVPEGIVHLGLKWLEVTCSYIWI